MEDNKIISYLKLDDFVKSAKLKKQSIILVGGCFDILHPGHIEFLRKSSAYADAVIVLLESDNNVKRRKGEARPIHPQKDRARLLAGIGSVAGVVLLPDIMENDEYFELVKRISPDIIGISGGDPLTEVKKRQAAAVRGKLIEVIPRIEEYSTRFIIEKVRNL